MAQRDLLVIGGGIVGLATAYRYLQQNPGSSVTVAEKESAVGMHQSGRNSGVLHSGIYYQPGSYRAKLCVEGKLAMEQFCHENSVAYERCGKVIVAVSADELPGLQAIYEKGQANGVRCELIGPERLRELEPHVNGIKAIHVPDAGIVDYSGVCQKLALRIEEMGGKIVLNARITGIHERSNQVIAMSTSALFHFATDQLVSCAGLYSDKVAAMGKAAEDIQIVPFRGEYYKLKPTVEHFCNGLIYPVPDPAFPFLGVHFTKMALGGVECGPNAVLALRREGYRKTDVDWDELREIVRYPGFRKLAFKYWPQGAGEMWRSFNKRAFVKALQRLIPEIRASHLTAIPAGVRATALKEDGSMFDDFAFTQTARTLHVVNAPSPAATASLAIASMIVDKLG